MGELSPLAMTEEQIDEAILSGDTVETDTEEAIVDSEEEETLTEEEEVSTDAEEDTETEEEEASEEQDEGIDSEEEVDENIDGAEDTDEEVEDTDSNEVDYKAEYEKVFSPFKANGKTVKIDNAEEAVRLMQMGANYSKKMSALKPSLKVLKTLEKNDLLDQDKLNLLIDLSKKKPEAIAKFFKESGVDPFDLDLSENSEYTPETYTTSDSELELEEVLSNIRDTASYSETIDIVSNKWDTASKQVLVQNPHMIEVINEHVDNGTYAQITEAMEKQKLLGNLKGMTDLEAYKYVGEALHEQAQKQRIPAKVKVKPAQKKSVDPKLRNRKKEASLTGGRTTKTEQTPFNPLSLSPEELDNLDWSKYV